jgi:hypothetical protein
VCILSTFFKKYLWLNINLCLNIWKRRLTFWIKFRRGSFSWNFIRFNHNELGFACLFKQTKLYSGSVL